MISGKDPGVPNILPFKESFLKDVAEAKMKVTYIILDEWFS